MSHSTVCSIVALLLASAGCGGSSPVSTGSDKAQDAGLSGGTQSFPEGRGGNGSVGVVAGSSPSPCYGGCSDGASRPSPGPRPQCPPDEPKVGTSCAAGSLACSYGDAPTANCRRHYECSAGTWRETGGVPSTSARPVCLAPAAQQAFCPKEYPHEKSCTVSAAGSSGATCVYGNLVCFCVSRSGESGMAGTWRCYGAPQNTNCPGTLPNIGEGCPSNGVQCQYTVEACSAHPNSWVYCYSGRWERGGPVTGCL